MRSWTVGVILSGLSNAWIRREETVEPDRRIGRRLKATVLGRRRGNRIVRGASSSYSYSAERYSYSNEGGMTDPIFDHEKLDVYRLSIVEQINRSAKSQLKRVVAMLSRLIQRTVPVAEKANEYEYRSAEYE
jgi:hypothetical protein